MKKILYPAIALAAVLPLTGCSDFLDAKDKTNGNLDADTYLTENAEDTRAAAYDALRPLATNVAMTDEQADLYIDARAANDGNFATFNVAQDNSDVLSFYNSCNKLIYYANTMIHFGGEGSDIAEEARFLRNVGYYYLTQEFGAVPYVDWYVDTPDRSYPRMPLAELYPKLLADLEDLYNNSKLPAEDRTGKVSKQAVAALAAKIALAAAWDLDTQLVNAEQGTYTVTNTEMFAKAAEWAEKAINGIQLTMSFADKWSPYNEANQEVIFAVQYDKATYPGDKTNGGHSLMNDYLAYYGNCVVTGMKGTTSGGRHGMSQKSLGMWEKGDTRFDATFMTTMYNPIVENLVEQWPKIGYLAPWVCTADELAQQPLGMRFYPPTTTTAEAEADLRTFMSTANGKMNQLVKPEKENVYGINDPFAAILTPDNVVVWKFNTRGTMPSKTTMSFQQFYVEQAANGGTCVKKFDDPTAANVTGKQDYRDLPILHVSEMYLTAAEAYLLAGQESKALEKINAVRDRAGVKHLNSFGDYVTPYTTPVGYEPTSLDLILDERARETYAERTRWLDIRRTKQMVRYNLAFSRAVKTVSVMSNANGEIKWYKPIPEKEINNNTGIDFADQNPGY